MDSVQYNAEHCGINDDTDDEHTVESESFVLIQWIRAYPCGNITAQRAAPIGFFKKCKF